MNIVAGFAGQERGRRVIGIDGSAKPEETLEQVSRIARATAELLELRELRDDELVLDDRYHAGTYGIPDEQTLDPCIAIRTIVLRDGVAHLQAGAGIVADSDPAAEHEECLRKLAAVEAAIDLAESEQR